MFHSPVPALSTVHLSLMPFSLTRFLKIASAVGDLQMLPQQTKRTECFALGLAAIVCCCCMGGVNWVCLSHVSLGG